MNPLILLPVRIETRFIDAGGDPELWLRVYPDQISVDSHQVDLTGDEIDDGKRYWTQVWTGGIKTPPGEEARAPWRWLAARHGSARSAYIALQLTPINASSQPAAASDPPVPPPSFPTLTPRDPSAGTPALARLLPDAWTVLLYSDAGVEQHQGSPITGDLAVGLTPGGGTLPPDIPVDEGMRWLVDFDAAVTAGMALRIPITRTARTSGFTRIVVFGVRSKASADDLATLLNAHHYTDGLSFVPQGAPTNNTPDASSAFTRADTDYDWTFEVERSTSLLSAADCDGNAAASALGVSLDTFAHVAYAGGTGVRNGHNMMTALWPATLGYFFSQMMASVFNDDQVELGRQFAKTYAIPRGPVPAFRVGKVPYGVLPVTILSSQEGSAYDDEFAPLLRALEPLLARMLPVWASSTQNAPHVGASSDPDKDLMTLLGMDASAMQYRGRGVLGDLFIWNLMQFAGLPGTAVQAFWTQYLQSGRAILNAYGLSAWDPRVIHLTMRDTAFPVTDPSIHVKPLSETSGLENDGSAGGSSFNYIEWIRNATPGDLRANAYPGPLPAALLYKILRQSVLQDYVGLSGSADVRAGTLARADTLEPELVNVAAAKVTMTAWTILARPSPVAELSWAEYLHALVPPAGSPFIRLGELRDSLDAIAQLSTAELDRLLSETLDACSHRIDVWIAAIASARLAALRRERQERVTGIGAFGWVHDIVPAAPAAQITQAESATVTAMDRLRSKRAGRTLNLAVPAAPLSDNGGYILAPSITQAEVAAVLRNGYMTHKNGPNDGLLHMDLSSDRVRNALDVLDGVRQGQKLGAVLGYRLEEAMSSPDLEPFIQPLRDRFPMVGDALTPLAQVAPAEAVSASDVVDAVALRQAWIDGDLPPGANWGGGLPGPGTPQDKLILLFQALDDTMSALSELSIAESVFQVMRGNFGRSGGLLDAASRGLYPPSVQVVDTPRTGIDLTHRVMLLFAQPPVRDAAWAATQNNAVAITEPQLDNYLSQRLPDPAKVICVVSWISGGAPASKNVALAALNLSPLEFLALADPNDRTLRSELESRVIVAAALPAGATQIAITFTGPSLPPGSVGFLDALTIASSWREVFGAARALLPPDFIEPEHAPTDYSSLVDTTELTTRANALIARFAPDVAALNAAYTGLPGTIAALRTSLQTCSAYGISGAFKTLLGDDTLVSTNAKGISADLSARLKTASDAQTAGDPAGVIAAIFGKNFRILMRCTLPDPAEFNAALTQSPTLLASATQAYPVERWLQQLTHVRPAISRLDSAYLTTDLFFDRSRAAPTLVQMPAPAALPDRWLALPIDPNAPPASGRVAIAAWIDGNASTSIAFSGLLIDEWPERVPGTQQSIGLSFHYEEPKAQAPQSLLLAVPAAGQEMWDAQSMRTLLEQAFDLTRSRTVDLGSLSDFGQILPALYFAFNVDEQTVSTRFFERSVVSGRVTIDR